MRQKHRNIIFFIPLWYTYTTRLKTISKAISLVIIYFIPECVLFYFQQPEMPLSRLLLLSVFAILGVYTVYEIGYIQNDTETIKLEKHPTRRLSAQQLEFYGQYRVSIYVIRIMLACIFSFALYFLTEQQGIFCYSLGLIAILAVYQGYNHKRGYIITLFYFLLVSLRYVVPLMLFSDALTTPLIVLALLIFPIPQTTMFRYFRKYILKLNPKRLVGYRVVIYAVLCVVGIGLFLVNFFPMSYVCLIAYMFFYRIILFLFSSNPR